MKLADFIHFRKELHSYPEVSGNEKETKRRVLHFIRQFNPDEIIEAGRYGIIFAFHGEEKGRSIMIRAELDALPIAESNDFEHRSTVEKVSHKCGHDGHMAILAHLAYRLSQDRPKTGICYLLFQPAEENGTGAKEVFHSRAFQQLAIDRIFALHNLPSYPLNSIVVLDGAFTPAVSSIIVKYTGKTSHAAEPEMGINPALALADYIQQSSLLTQSDANRQDFFLVTPIYLTMGELSYGVSAGYGEVHLTVRAMDNQLLKEKSAQLEAIAAEVAGRFHLQHRIEWVQEFKANKNDADCVNRVRAAAGVLNLALIERNVPMKWGEDFGLFTAHYKGAMFGLGAGKSQPALHNPDYDFPDELIETGSAIFEQIIKDFLDVKNDDAHK